MYFGYFFKFNITVVNALPIQINIKRIFTRQNIIATIQGDYLSNVITTMDEEVLNCSSAMAK